MAGHSMEGDADNPVGINITAMVDVIFCLCIFFMCSFHFKQLEGKFDTWLPKHGGIGDLKGPVELEEIRVSMTWDRVAKVTRRRIAARTIVNDSDLMSTILSMEADHRARNRKPPVKIDADSDVPWHDVVHVVDLCKEQKLDRVEFVEPMEMARR